MARVRGPNAPTVSTVIGMKHYEASKCWYLASFLSSASAATTPASLVALTVYGGENVSEHVASQTNSCPLSKETTMIPSGLSSHLSGRCWLVPG